MYVCVKSNVLTLEPCNIVGWIFLVSIDVWAQVAIFTHFIRMWTRSGRCKIIGVGCHVIGIGCVLGRAPCTKETLPDFHEWCRVTRRPRVFR